MSADTGLAKLQRRPGAEARTASLAYWARSLARRRLARLEHGRIDVIDPWGSWQAGAGEEPAAALRVKDPRAYVDLIAGGSLGAAEAYMQGRWTSDDLTALLRVFLRNHGVSDAMEAGTARIANLVARLRHARRANTSEGSRRNIGEHYDLGNELFALFLDETMTYSAGIFEHPSATLREASLAKLDRICRKLELGPRDRVLEIGTGWGSFAVHAASRYGCRVTTTTISRQQHALAARRIREAGLGDRIELLLADYRTLAGRFDKLVSIEMIEAVGHEYLPGYFEKCASLLEDDGRMLVQAITMPDQRYEQYLESSDFIRRHVFPGSCVPSIGAMVGAMAAASDLKLVHLEDIGAHYARTLRCWRDNFLARVDEVRALGYSERFVRMWEYYLCYCEAGFAERYIGDVQMLLNKPQCRAEPLLPPLSAASAREPAG